MDFMSFHNEILEEIKAEEMAEQERKAEIIKNGCPHTEKVRRKSLVYKTEWLECSVCGKQFYLDCAEVLCD